MAKNTPEVGAQIEAALAPLKEAIFQTARLEGRHESGEAYAADALAEMARRSVAADDARPGGDARPGDGEAVPGPVGADEAGNGETVSQAGGDEAEDPNDVPAGDPGDADAAEPADPDDAEAAPPADPEAAPAPKPARSRRPDTKVIVLISYEALKRGLAEAGEICEIAGTGPVSVATVRSLLGDAFGAAIVTNGVDVFTVAHLGRSATAFQRSALEARGYRCEVPGCGSTTALEIDHIDDWHLSFRTKLDQLCWLCGGHHHDKTHRGWRLEGPPGDRRWLPPGEAGAQRDERAPDPPTPESGEPPTRFADPSAA
jgi:hypothetical protein